MKRKKSALKKGFARYGGSLNEGYELEMVWGYIMNRACYKVGKELKSEYGKKFKWREMLLFVYLYEFQNYNNVPMTYFKCGGLSIYERTATLNKVKMFESFGLMEKAGYTNISKKGFRYIISVKGLSIIDKIRICAKKEFKRFTTEYKNKTYTDTNTLTTKEFNDMGLLH